MASSNSNSIESWVLMALIYKDLDDFDYKNALLLAERLYAMDKTNQDFLLVYAKCFYLLQDYNATYDILQKTTSVPCCHLYARSCLALGDLSDRTDKSAYFWKAGVQALRLALDNYPNSNAKHNWGEDFMCVAIRSHLPSKATITHLLGVLYSKLENLNASSANLRECLVDNPFKLAAYTKLCDIAPDLTDLGTNTSPDDIFKEFSLDSTKLDRLPIDSHFPPLPYENLAKTSKKHVPQQTPPSPVAHVPSAPPPKLPASLSLSPPQTLESDQSVHQTASATASSISSAFASQSLDLQARDEDSPFIDKPVQKRPLHQLTIEEQRHIMEPYMPMLRSAHAEITLDQLKSLVRLSIPAHSPLMAFENIQSESDAIQNVKERILQNINSDIEKGKLDEAFKNKHGLHKKPPAEVTQDLSVELADGVNEDIADHGVPNCSDLPPAPRLISSPLRHTGVSSSLPQSNHDHIASTPGIKTRLRSKRSSISQESNSSKKQKQKQNPVMPASNCDFNVAGYFVPWLEIQDQLKQQQQKQSSSQHLQTNRPSLGKTTTGTTVSALSSKAAKEISDQPLVNAMNKLIKIIRILAKAYEYQTTYHCHETAMELQKLDDRQYDTASVLALIAQAYYDSGDYEMARMFYRRSYYIAPWYCKIVPIYSTCLWYLENELELNLLAYKTKENYSHRYEAYIAAGNWTKCAKRGNEAIRWFQKAVELDPNRSYGHALLGYEEWEKGNFLGAKQHFIQCLVTNRRSYFGWYGGARAYCGMHEYAQARTLMDEALRLHPRQPILLDTMADILFNLKNYEAALDYVTKSLALRKTPANGELKRKIMQKLDISMDDDDDDNASFHFDIL